MMSRFPVFLIPLLTFLGSCSETELELKDYQDQQDFSRTAHQLKEARELMEITEFGGTIEVNSDDEAWPYFELQEMDQFRTDIRIVNLSLLETEYYANALLNYNPYENMETEDLVALAIDSIWNTEPIQEQEAFMLKQTNGERQLTAIEIPGDSTYTIRFSEDNGMSMVTHFTFEVQLIPVFSIQYYDPITDSKTDLGTWIKEG